MGQQHGKRLTHHLQISPYSLSKNDGSMYATWKIDAYGLTPSGKSPGHTEYLHHREIDQ